MFDKNIVATSLVVLASAGHLPEHHYGDQVINAPYDYRRSYATILRLDNDVNSNGYHYAYDSSDGSKAEQQGRVLPGATVESGSLVVDGSFSYVGPDGQSYSVSYTADENGYRPQGAHLPTPPPIPEAILRSLSLLPQTNGNVDDGQYVRSSYQAHHGY